MLYYDADDCDPQVMILDMQSSQPHEAVHNVRTPRPLQCMISSSTHPEEGEGYINTPCNPSLRFLRQQSALSSPEVKALLTLSCASSLP